MKILIVSQYYLPENVLIPSTVAADLTRKGHKVRVLTGFPNYPKGRLFEGYSQKWREKSSLGPAQVMRVPLFLDHSTRSFQRSLNYISFAFSAMSARSFSRGADVIYVYATQMTPALGPWVWRLTGGVPYVLHVQDLWPDSITGSSLVRSSVGAHLVQAALKPWLSSVYRNAAAVIGIAPTMVDRLVERGVSRRKAHLVFNWADESGVTTDQELESDAGSLDETRILYAGNVGDMQDLETVVHAAHETRDASIKLTILGEGVALSRVRALTEQLGATNIDFIPTVSREDMSRFYGASDYALVTLKNLPVFQGTIPSKFQSALAHNVPVITSVSGDVSNIVEETGVGFTAAPESVKDLALAFRKAAAVDKEDRKKMAILAGEVYRSRFSLESGSSCVEEILRTAAGDQRE